MDLVPRNKSLIEKLKTSPAAKQYREEGGMKVAKTLGGFAKEGLQNFSDKVLDTIAPLDNTHMKTRAHHFNEGAGTEVPILASDEEKFYKFHERGIGAGSHDNVSSIVNGIVIRGQKAARKPEGY
jgi:hypothetical protein